MVDGLHTHIQNRVMKSLAITLNEVKSGVHRGGGNGGDETQPMYKLRLFRIVTMNPFCITNIF
jgi:hypothetical protein